MTEPRSRARQLLTLTGVVPLGVFLLEHILTNTSAMGGGARFDGVVGSMARSPLAPVVEIGLVLAPLAVHAAVGLSLARSPELEGHHTYASDRLYRLQRISGMVALAFVVAHLFELRLRRWLWGLSLASLYTRLSGDLSWTWAGIPWVALAYLAGVAAASFHFVNGIWAYLAGRGNRPSRAASLGLGALGGLLFLLGAATTVSVSTGTRLLTSAEGSKSAHCGPDSAPPAPTGTASR